MTSLVLNKNEVKAGYNGLKPINILPKEIGFFEDVNGNYHLLISNSDQSEVKEFALGKTDVSSIDGINIDTAEAGDILVKRADGTIGFVKRSDITSERISVDNDADLQLWLSGTHPSQDTLKQGDFLVLSYTPELIDGEKAPTIYRANQDGTLTPLSIGSGGVLTVNGKTGAVIDLLASDVGAVSADEFTTFKDTELNQSISNFMQSPQGMVVIANFLRSAEGEQIINGYIDSKLAEITEVTTSVES